MGKIDAIRGTTIYLDANIFIYAMEDMAGSGQLVRDLFARCDRGELHAVTSELSLAEVLAKPIRDGKSEIQSRYRALLQTSRAMTVAPVDRSVLDEAAIIRAKTSLKLPDAIHTATCLLRSCSTLVTRFAAYAGTHTVLVSDLLTLP